MKTQPYGQSACGKPSTPVCLAAQLGKPDFLAVTFFVIPPKTQLCHRGRRFSEAIYCSFVMGNVPRVRAKCLRKGKWHSVDRSLVSERTAKMMMVACLLLFSIWTTAPGNSLVCLGVCVIILTVLGTSVAVPASFCAAGCCIPHLAPSWGKPSDYMALVALCYLPGAQAGCSDSIHFLIYHQCIYKFQRDV